jgi:hypothetical protein
MSKTAQSNYKPQKISAGAVLERIKDGTHIPESKIKGTKEIVNLFDKFEEINAKNNCLRVRFYDWFADYLEKTALKMRDRAFKITSPCSISMPPQKPKKVNPDTTVIEKILAEDRLNKDSASMKLPNEEVKKMVPDLTPDHDDIIAVKNATEIADIMANAGNSSTTMKITPDTKEKK